MAYHAQVQRIIDYIENHLEEDLELEPLAAQAGYSLWHFQKIFSGSVGTGLKEYIRARKLTHALGLIMRDESPLREIARSAGFDSQEAFTRAFKKMFGTTPARCRREGAEKLVTRTKPKITLSYLQNLYRGGKIEPRILDFPERCAVGMMITFISALSPDKNNQRVLPVLWRDFLARAREVGAEKNAPALGVCQPLSPALSRVQPHNCLYLAGLQVPQFGAIPRGMCALVIPAGRFAVFEHHGHVSSITQTAQYIYGSWLPKSGMTLRDSPEVELYDYRFNSESEDSVMEIQVPVE